MQQLFRNSRFWIILGCITLLVAIALHYGLFGTAPMYSKLVRTYALWAAALLLCTLLITPLILIFPKVPLRAELVHARRAIGVSAAFFAIAHSWLAFFKQLGGFPGLAFLTTRYLVAITFSALALLILLILTFTSFDSAQKRLGRWWKRIHSFIYLAGFLVLYHALSIGSHLTDLRTPQARVMLMLVFTLLLLQALRLDRRWQPQGVRVGVFTLGVLVVCSFTLATFAGTPEQSGLSIHTSHSPAATPTTNPLSLAQKKYTLSIQADPATPVPGKTTRLTLRVYDAASGTQVTRFTQLYEQFMHIIIVDSALGEFYHIHPATQADGSLVAEHVFTRADVYRLYTSFVPYQDVEQQIGTSLGVGDAAAGRVPQSVREDTEYQKPVGNVVVNSGQHVLKAAEVNSAQKDLVFSVSGTPTPELAPYIGAFGHLTLINIDTYEFVHIHPKDMRSPKPDERAAPVISFTVMSGGAQVKPGTYRAIVELAPNGIYSPAAFTLTFE